MIISLQFFQILTLVVETLESLNSSGSRFPLDFLFGCYPVDLNARLEFHWKRGLAFGKIPLEWPIPLENSIQRFTEQGLTYAVDWLLMKEFDRCSLESNTFCFNIYIEYLLNYILITKKIISFSSNLMISLLFYFFRYFLVKILPFR